jgi:hypothetical protein
MQTASPNFDRETVELLKRVLVESEEMLPTEARTSEIRVRLASGILSAATVGERDPGRLRSAALSRVDRRLLRFRGSWLD